MQTFKFFNGFTFKKSHAFKIQVAKMPYCAVYFMGENLSPDGDADIGEVRFNSIARIGFSIIMINNDEDAMEDQLDNAYQVTFNGLLCDPTLYNNNEFKIQSYVRGARAHFYGIAGSQNNETPYAELRAELHCNLGAIEYEPLVEYMLDTIHVETAHPPGSDGSVTQHVFSVYDVNTMGDEDNG
jgi:hypothetical protein